MLPLRPTTIEKICTELIEPIYYNDIQDCINNRKYWKRIYYLCQGISRVSAGTATVLSFASAMFQNRILLSFWAGSLSVIAIVFQQFAAYSLKEHKINNDELVRMLVRMHIHSIPNLLEHEDVDSENDENV